MSVMFMGCMLQILISLIFLVEPVLVAEEYVPLQKNLFAQSSS